MFILSEIDCLDTQQATSPSICDISPLSGVQSDMVVTTECCAGYKITGTSLLSDTETAVCELDGTRSSKKTCERE